MEEITTVEQINDLRMNTQRFLNGWYDYKGNNAMVVPNYQAWYYWRYDNSIARVKVIDLQWKAMGENYLPTERKSKDKTKKRGFNVVDMMEKWEGVQIGHDIFIRCQRGSHQIRPATNFRRVELDYFGIQTKESIIRIGWGLQMLYDITMLQIEFLLNQAGGKATVIYLDDIPNGADGKPKYELDDIIYMAKVMGVIVKQRKEGVALRGDSNSYGQVDFGVGNSMQPLIELKAMLEQTARTLTGVNDVRLGFNKPDAGLGVTNNALVQSNYITAPIFNAHSKVTECALNKMATLQKILYPSQEKKAYVLGDMSWKVLQWTKDMALSETGIRVYDSYQNNMKKEKMVGLASQVLSTEPLMVLEIVKMMNAGSEIEAQKILENGVETMRKINDDMKERQLASAERANELAAQRLDFDMKKAQQDGQVGLGKSKLAKEGQVESAQLRKEGMIEVAQINTTGAIDHQMLKDTNEEDLAHKMSQMQEAAPVQ